MGRPLFIDEQIKQRIGSKRTNKRGESAVCIQYNDCKNIIIQFENSNITKKVSWTNFDNGAFALPFSAIQENRIGTKSKNKRGDIAECIEYNSSSNITIKINNIVISGISWGNFIAGKFRLNKFGAYVGSEHIYECESVTKEYETWMSMLKRCYSKSVKYNRPSYDECKVCSEWMNYENFYNWIVCQPNYSHWKNAKTTKWCLDKDLLIKGNKLYSPEYCVLVPNNINCLIIKCDSHRGKYPIGVYLDKTIGLFRAQCENPKYGRQICLGFYEDPESAFKAYKIYKEKLIKQIATEEYQNGNITERCYNAMMNYEVEITD